MNLRILVPVIMAALAWASSARSDAIVDWGGAYVSGSRGFVLPTAEDDGGVRTFPYSDSAAITPASGYSTPAGKSGPFYGALELISNDGTPRNFAQAQVSRESGTGDSFMRVGQASGVAGSVRGLVFFVKGNFLNGYDGVTLSLGGLSGEMNIRAIADTGSFRFAVRDGSSWYLSETARTTTGDYTIDSLSVENWGLWDPTGSPVAALPAGYATSGGTLNDVTAFGFYFTASRSSSAAVEVNSFQIIPEPGTVSLLLMGTALFGAARFSVRRR